MSDKIKIFVSYSHEDEVWVSSTKPDSYKLIPWLDKQLKKSAEIWIDHALKELPGEEYTKLITKKILDADIALLLISQDFVSSEYIMTKELPLIKEQYDINKIKIIPLLITKVSDDGKEGISWIFDLQTYPNDTKPLISFVKDPSEWSEAKIEILNGINNKIKSIRNPKPEIVVVQEPPSKPDEKVKSKLDTIPQVLSGTKFKPNSESQTSFLKNNTLTEVINGVSFDMVFVEGGSFLMGITSDEDERFYDKEQHKRILDNFYIGKFEVTQLLWKTVMGEKICYCIGDSRPVDSVSWHECQVFIRRLNRLTGKKYRLPTEAEWEYAARGGNRSMDYIYSGSDIVDEVAWYENNSDNQTHDVGTKAANELGLYDMSGNVRERCQEWFGSSETHCHVCRGGSSYNEKICCQVAISSFSGHYYSNGKGWLDEESSISMSLRNFCFEDIGYDCTLGLRLALDS